MPSVLYSSARAVLQEKNLLGADRLKRMIEGGKSEAWKILAEVGFGAGETEDAEKAISAEIARLSAFINETAPDEKIGKFFLYPFDFRNAEALVKSKYLKTEPVLSAGGSIDVKRLKDKIFSDEYSTLPKFMASALAAADKTFVDGKASGLYINSLFTKALYDELFSLGVREKCLAEILKASADFIDVGVCLRTRDYNKAKTQIVRLGKLGENDLKALCESDFGDLREKFRFSDYKDVINVALNGLENGEGLKEFEKARDEYAVKLIKKREYDSDGAFPFIRYCYYKFADVQNARIILVGLAGGLSESEITERLREGYEG